MKTKLILRKNRIIGVFTVIMGIVGLSLVFQGCEKNELFSDIYPTYLDVDISKKVFSEQDLIIYEEALQRIDQHIKVQNGRYVTQLRSGKDVNISEELFQLFKQQLINTNKVLSIADYNYDANRKVFYSTFNSLNINSVRLKKNGENPFPDFDYEGFDMRVEWNWYGSDIVLSHQVFNLVLAGGAAASAWLAILCPPSAAFVITVVIGAEYAYSGWGNGRGIRIKIRPYPCWPYQFN